MGTRETTIAADVDRICELASTAEGRLSLIGTLVAFVPLPALNRGDVWVVAVMQAIYAVTCIADDDMADLARKWTAVVNDAPLDYVLRVRTALEEA